MSEEIHISIFFSKEKDEFVLPYQCPDCNKYLFIHIVDEDKLEEKMKEK